MTQPARVERPPGERRFDERVVASTPARQRAHVKAQAGELWARATRVMALREA